MSSIAETFPSLAALAVGELADGVLAYEFDPGDRIALFTVISGFGAFVVEQDTEVDALFNAGSSLLDEIDQGLTTGTFEHDALAFGVGTFMAEVLLDRGEHIGALAHLQRARAVAAPEGGW